MNKIEKCRKKRKKKNIKKLNLAYIKSNFFVNNEKQQKKRNEKTSRL